jgi:hypothetical protein
VNLPTILLPAGVLVCAEDRPRAVAPPRQALARDVAFLLVYGTMNAALLLA